MALPFEPNQRVLFVGQTQSGKTTLFKRYLRELPSAIIFDFKKQYADVATPTSDPRQIIPLLRKGHRKIAFQPPDARQAWLDYFCELSWCNLRRTTLVFEEIGSFVSPGFIPSRLRDLVMISQGKPYELGLVFLNPRPTGLHNDILSQVTHVFSFSQDNRNDVGRLCNEYSQQMSQVQGLAPYEFVHFDRITKKVERHGANNP
jgi:energy-coupling factor transporter ATP-binding protein EcfA2